MVDGIPGVDPPACTHDIYISTCRPASPQPPTAPPGGAYMRMVIVIARFFDGVGKGRCSVVALQRWDWERQVPDRSTTTASAAGGGGYVGFSRCFVFDCWRFPRHERPCSSTGGRCIEPSAMECEGMAGDVRSERAGERRWLGLSGDGHGGAATGSPRLEHLAIDEFGGGNIRTPIRTQCWRWGGGGGRRATAYHQVTAIGRLSRRSVSSRTQVGNRQVEWIQRRLRGDVSAPSPCPLPRIRRERPSPAPAYIQFE